MYSNAKAQLEREKQEALPIQLVGNNLGTENLSEKAKAAQEILKSLDPILKARERQQQQIEVLCKAIDNYSGLLESLTSEFSTIKTQLQEIVNSKTVNAQKESLVLDKLMEVL